MVSNYWAAGVLVAAMVGLPAVAQDTDPAAKAAVTVSDLDAIMQEEILLKAMAARAKQRAELDRYPDTTGNVGVTQSPAPNVAWRRATASGWLAKFMLAGGETMIAGVGDTLPGGYAVTQINAGGVKVRLADTVIELSAAGTQSSEPRPAPPPQ